MYFSFLARQSVVRKSGRDWPWIDSWGFSGFEFITAYGNYGVYLHNSVTKSIFLLHQKEEHQELFRRAYRPLLAVAAASFFGRVSPQKNP
jgi:hypothetical protein